MRLTAFFGGLAFPGLGHLLMGRCLRGILWTAVIVAIPTALVAAVVKRAPVLALVVLCVASVLLPIIALVDAVRCGREPRWQWGRWWSRGLVVVAAFFTVGWGYNELLSRALPRFVRPFFGSTNAMLPAIAGRTVPSRCTKCGLPVRLAPRDAGMQSRQVATQPTDWAVGVCPHCGTLLDDTAYPNQIVPYGAPDRFLVTTLVAPRRWDIVAFYYPDDPTEQYVKRLVGLPGETVEIVDGAVMIDGQLLEKPAHLQYLHYLNLDFPRWPGWGQEGKPVTLGADEFFVLGDFSARSRDSRGWERGAPRHTPYAVPREYLVGVATHIYWPPSRWRVFEQANDGQ